MELESLFLKNIFGRFNFNVKKLNINKLGNSSNLIYEFKEGKEEYILRISEKPFEFLDYYEGEMDFVNYLFEGKANVSRVISSKNNRLVEVIEQNGIYYFISIFEKAKGNVPNVNDGMEWNSELFYKWGQVMGRIHNLSKTYSKHNSEVRRNQWNEDIYFSEEFSLINKDDDIYKVWNEIVSEIRVLPKDEESYGLIHYDFHQYNFFNYNGEITVFDFDDCLYHWFACDIAIAIYHAIEAMRFINYEEKNQFASNFIKNFMNGYLLENYIDQYWTEKIPLFLEYRRICSYRFMCKILEEKDLDERKKVYMANRKEEIENRVLYIDFNFKCIV